jgi:hypothetical protein
LHRRAGARRLKARAKAARGGRAPDPCFRNGAQTTATATILDNKPVASVTPFDAAAKNAELRMQNAE